MSASVSTFNDVGHVRAIVCQCMWSCVCLSIAFGNKPVILCLGDLYLLWYMHLTFYIQIRSRNYVQGKCICYCTYIFHILCDFIQKGFVKASKSKPMAMIGEAAWACILL